MCHFRDCQTKSVNTNAGYFLGNTLFYAFHKVKRAAGLMDIILLHFKLIFT